MGKKGWITTGIVAALAAAYTAGGFWGVPYGIQWALKKYGEPFIDRKISLQEVKFNPFTLHLQARGLTVLEKDSDKPFVGLQSLDTKIKWESLFRFSPMIDHLTMDKFSANVIRTGLDTFNFSDIIQKIVSMPKDPEDDQKKDDDPLRFALENISLNNSQITLDDKFRDKVDKLTDINFALPLISNFKTEVDHPITPKLQFDFNGEPFSINASSELFIPRLKTGVNFTIQGLNLENAATFNPIPLNGKITQGTMDAALNLDFAKDADDQAGYLRLKGTLKILNLAIEDNLNAPYTIANFKEINVNLKEFALFKQILTLGEVQFQEPVFEIIRNQNGINVAELATHLIKEEAKTPKTDDKGSDTSDAPLEAGPVTNSSAVTEPGASVPENAPESDKPQVPADKEGAANQAALRVLPLTSMISSVYAAEDPAKVASANGVEVLPAENKTESAKNEATDASDTKSAETKTEAVGVAEAKSAETKTETVGAPDAKPKETRTETNGSLDGQPVAGENKTPGAVDVQNAAAQTENAPDEPKHGAQPDGPNAQPNPGWNWSVEKASIRNGTVHFSDTTNGFKETITDIRASVTGLCAEKDKKSDVKVSLDVIGGKIAAEGYIELNPLEVSLEIKSEALNVAQLMPYIGAFTKAKIAAGTFGNEGSFRLAVPNDALQLSYDGNARLGETTINDANGVKTVAFSAVNVNGIHFNGLNAIEVQLAEIDVRDPFVRVVREKDDSVNLVALAQAPASSGTRSSAVASDGTTGSKSSPAPAWSIGKIHVQNGLVDFTDTTNGFHRNVSGLFASVSSLSSKAGGQSPVEASLNVLGGKISAKGNVQLSPLNVALNVNSNALSIADLTPYISQYSNAHVTKGTFGNSGQISLSLASEPIKFAYEGSASINGISVSGPSGAPVVSLQRLDAGGINVSGLAPLSIKADSVVLASPIVNVVKAKDGALNVATLAEAPKKASGTNAKSNSQATSSKTKASDSSEFPAIYIGKIQLKDGRVRFTDNGMNPVFTMNASNLDGDLIGLSSDRRADAKINLKGLLNGTPLAVTGKLNPFGSNLSVDMEGSVQSLSLPSFSAFSAQYTGYPITKGHLTYKGNLNINKDDLQSENSMIINKLEFGPEAPDAKETLPVGLAVSLLQDRSGQIDLNIPVSGSLSDPEFSVGGIVVKVIVNLITKAVTAPFALIGSMFGGENMDLNNLQFLSGSSKLDEQNLKALGVIGKAMTERPGIKIQIIGSATDQNDQAGIKERLLMRSMRYAIYRDTTSATNAKVLTPQQIASAVKTLYNESTVPNKPKLTTVQDMQKFLLKHQCVTTADLTMLADQRARAVRDYLIQKEKINPDRLFIVTSKTAEGGPTIGGVSLELQD